MTDKPKAPASYFPSIEAKYGHPIAHWQNLVRLRLPAKHGELVAFSSRTSIAWAMATPTPSSRTS